MTDINAAIAEYLELRRRLGFKLEEAGRLLPDFARYAERREATAITTELALAWAAQPGFSPERIADRLSAVRLFAVHLQAVDPTVEVPPADLVIAHRRRVTPHLFSRADVAAILAATTIIDPPLAAATFATLIGLLAVSGLRLGEALRLDRTDVDFDTAALTIRLTKFNKTREVPLHPSAVDALAAYDRQRSLVFPAATWFFASATGARLSHNAVYPVFARLLDAADIHALPRARRPRPHDLRHSFAVETVTGWYRDGGDVEARLPLLSTYLGHLEPVSTYWYLSATPELLSLAARRLEADRAVTP